MSQVLAEKLKMEFEKFTNITCKAQYLEKGNSPKPEITLSNYPNPFNPETTISFSVTQNSDFVTLEVYNVKGQKVKTLHPFPNRGLGTRCVVWNGTDSNNKPVSSGIYMYQLKVNGKAIAGRKCLLLKWGWFWIRLLYFFIFLVSVQFYFLQKRMKYFQQ